MTWSSEIMRPSSTGLVRYLPLLLFLAPISAGCGDRHGPVPQIDGAVDQRTELDDERRPLTRLTKTTAHIGSAI